MSNKIYALDASGSNVDLQRTQLTPLYPLGKIVTIVDKKVRNPEFLLEFIYIKNTKLSPMIAFEPIVIKESVIKNAEIFGSQILVQEGKAITLVAVPQFDILLNQYGFVQIRGNASAVVQGDIGTNFDLKFPLDALSPPRLIKNANNKQTLAKTTQVIAGVNIKTIRILLLGKKVAIPNT